MELNITAVTCLELLVTVYWQEVLETESVGKDVEANNVEARTRITVDVCSTVTAEDHDLSPAGAVDNRVLPEAVVNSVLPSLRL